MNPRIARTFFVVILVQIFFQSSFEAVKGKASIGQKESDVTPNIVSETTRDVAETKERRRQQQPPQPEPQSKDPLDDASQEQVSLLTGVQTASHQGNPTNRSYPLYMFGHSTGHVGSTAVQLGLEAEGCPFPMASLFETWVKNQSKWEYGIDDCALTNEQYLPFIDNRRQNKTFLDMGHFHIRGRVLECLASLLGDKAAFFHIRRSRYDIAFSFSHRAQTPCKKAESGLTSPSVALCPHSKEGGGPVNLPIEDAVWEGMTTFQKFLWNADEMEHRWHTIQRDHGGKLGAPHFYEISWDTGQELAAGVNDVRGKLQCNPLPSLPVTNPHVATKEKQCSQFILEDLEYRRMMNFSESDKRILFQYPQIVRASKCSDDIETLTKTVARANAIMTVGDTNIGEWKLIL